MIEHTKKSKKRNPEWLDKLIGKKPAHRDAITISVMDGTIKLSGKKFVDVGRELNDILETALKDLKIEFIPLSGKGKAYVLNRTTYDDREDSDMLFERSPRRSRPPLNSRDMQRIMGK